MADYIVLKKLKDTDDVKKFLDETYGIEMPDEFEGVDPVELSADKRSRYERALETYTMLQREKIGDLGYQTISDLFGTWIEAESDFCVYKMPMSPNKTEFTMNVSPVLIIVHDRGYVENVPIYEYKDSGIGLIRKEVWGGLW